MNIVWEGIDMNSDDQVYLYNGSDLIEVSTQTALYDPLPGGNVEAFVSGNNMVWRGYDENTDHIWLYACPAAIPTLSQWGIITLALIMLVLGVVAGKFSFFSRVSPLA
jgi:hypothetical protein